MKEENCYYCRDDKERLINAGKKVCPNCKRALIYSMNQTLTQIQEEELKRFDEVYFDRSQDGHPYAGDPLYDRLKNFLTQSNLRVIEKVKEWAENYEVEIEKGVYQQEYIRKDDLKNFLSLIEQK